MTFCRGANLFLGLFCESAMEQNFYLRFLVERSEIELLGKIAPRLKFFSKSAQFPCFAQKFYLRSLAEFLELRAKTCVASRKFGCGASSAARRLRCVERGA